MINRWTWFVICIVFGLLLMVCGWLMPVHLRAVEAPLLRQAGRNTPSLTSRGTDLLRGGELGAAEMFLRAPAQLKKHEVETLADAVDTTARQFPVDEAWGVADPTLNNYFPAAPVPGEALSDFVVHEENRKKALEFLEKSQQPAVRELLQTRNLAKLTTFAPSQEAGGEAFDAAVVMVGVLLDQQALAPGLRSDISTAALAANRGGNTVPLEQMLMDFISLGQRLNWGQLNAFLRKTESISVLNDQVDAVRSAGGDLPVLFAATELSGEPKAVADYAKNLREDGLKDLATALPFGAGGVQTLVQQDERIYTTRWRTMASEYEPFAAIQSFMAGYCWRTPSFALIVKWLLYFGAGFLLALALHFGRPPASNLEEPLQVRGFHVAREFLFALGFLLVVLLVSEPFLAHESTGTGMPFRLHIPTAGSAVQPGSTDIKASIMNQSNPIIILLFFVLQGLLYIACVVKLAEIRRQRVGPRVKLKLLENEEHLFDAGLYLGFLGTIVSFIVYSVMAGKGGHQFSLMVAYSSTSFGILFVSFFKIFHLRPTKRRLLLEAEAESEVASAPATAHAYPTS
jgi:hypothetical protein